MDNPKLRPVDAFPAEVSGQQVICLQDPTGVNENVIGISPALFFILQFFDGNHSLLDIQAAFMRQFGEMLTTDKIQEIVQNLDENFFLEGERFEQHKKQVVATYQNLEVRPSSHAGIAYPKEAEELRIQMQEYFSSNEDTVDFSKYTNRIISGLVAPHIDIQAGVTCYTSAYKALAKSKLPETFVILGTAHSGLEHFFAATAKDFQTPFGKVNVDHEFLERLCAQTGQKILDDEYAHKTEHVIEFQLVFLQYALMERGDFRIVPILCSFDHRHLDHSQFPQESERIEGFCRVLREVVSDTEGTCLIASVDFSHIGPRYGDAERPDPNTMERVRKTDESFLEAIRNGEAKAFSERVLQNDNWSRVCGIAPIYTMLSVLQEVEGEVLGYDEAEMDSLGSTVTFASAVLCSRQS